MLFGFIIILIIEIIAIVSVCNNYSIGTIVFVSISSVVTYSYITMWVLINEKKIEKESAKHQSSNCTIINKQENQLVKKTTVTVTDKYKKTLFNVVKNKSVTESKNGNTVTVALLYVVTDFILASKKNESLRRNASQSILSFIENYLDTNDIKTFNKAFNLIGGAIAHRIKVIGEWYHGERKNDYQMRLYAMATCYTIHCD